MVTHVTARQPPLSRLLEAEAPACIATFTTQGLRVASWLADVAQLMRRAVVGYLFETALALAADSLALIARSWRWF